MARARNIYGEKRNGYWISMGEAKGKRRLRRQSRSWVDNIKRDQVVCTGLIWLSIRTGVMLL
jgi:hypothetical protein